VLDWLSVRFLSGYLTRPIQMLGAIGMMLGAIGSGWTAILLFEKVAPGWSLGNRTALLLAVLLVVVGCNS
jgi:hypothetical protein